MRAKKKTLYCQANETIKIGVNKISIKFFAYSMETLAGNDRIHIPHIVVGAIIYFGTAQKL